MNRAFEKELSRALATELDTAAPKTLLRRCRAEHIVKQRSDWRDLLHCQFKLLGWKVWALEAMAALALYSVGRELALWEKAWTLRNALFGLSTLAMLTALGQFFFKGSIHLQSSFSNCIFKVFNAARRRDCTVRRGRPVICAISRNLSCCANRSNTSSRCSGSSWAVSARRFAFSSAAAKPLS